MSRHEGDYYPTPPCAVEGLREVIRSGFVPELTILFDRRALVLDPCAGAGTLLSWVAPDARERWAIEVNETLAEQCRIRGHLTQRADALVAEWRAQVVVMNPPFSALREFVNKALRQVAEHGGVACVLHPAQWSHTREQSDLPLGDRAELTWRPRFIPAGVNPATGKPFSGPSQTYVWEIWTEAMVLRPRASGRYMRVTRPPEDRARVEEHARIAGAIGRLGIGSEEAA